MKVSVIVPTFNRSALLRQTVESLIRQEFPTDDYEILVIDNACTDDTASVIEHLAANTRDRRLRYLYEPVPGLLAGRHRGAAEARGEILAYTDDDIVADPRWLASIAEAFGKQDVQLVGGKCLPMWEGRPPDWVEALWIRRRDAVMLPYYSIVDLGDRGMPMDPNYIWGLNFSIRKRALYDLGGFHPDCVPPAYQRYQGDGETGLTVKARARGFKAYYSPGAALRHVVARQRLTYDYMESRQFYQGVCDSYSAIRRAHRREGAAEPVFRGAASKVRRALVRARAALLGGKQRAAGNVSTLDRSVPAELRDVMDRGYRRGYEFHQKEVAADPCLLDWVLRDDYFDYSIPARSEAGGKTR